MIKFLFYASILFSSSVTAGESVLFEDESQFDQKVDYSLQANVSVNRDLPDANTAYFRFTYPKNISLVFRKEICFPKKYSRQYFTAIRAPPRSHLV